MFLCILTSVSSLTDLVIQSPGFQISSVHPCCGWSVNMGRSHLAIKRSPPEQINQASFECPHNKSCVHTAFPTAGLFTEARSGQNSFVFF